MGGGSSVIKWFILFMLLKLITFHQLILELRSTVTLLRSNLLEAITFVDIVNVIDHSYSFFSNLIV